MESSRRFLITAVTYPFLACDMFVTSERTILSSNDTWPNNDNDEDERAGTRCAREFTFLF